MRGKDLRSLPLFIYSMKVAEKQKTFLSFEGRTIFICLKIKLKKLVRPVFSDKAL